VERVEVYEWGGGKKAAKASIVVPLHEKVIFGIDDTDNPTSGATWALANEIGYKLNQEEGIDYINHSIVQLYPNNPYKTQNCVSIAISFASLPDKVDSLIEEVEKALEKYTDSEETGLAVHRGIIIPEKIKRYSNRAKLKMIEIGEAHKVAEECDIKLSTITGERGLIGALAAIGFADRPDDAVKVDV
jgi:methanogenesis imperfect marker protein 11